MDGGPPASERASFELRVLGRTELSTAMEEGEPRRSVTLQPKRFGLLAYLLLTRPRGFQRRDSVLVLFWPESDEAKARNALNQALHALRGTLGRGIVLSRGREEVGIAHHEIRCDAVEFGRALEASRPAKALDLYRGEFLAGLHLTGAPGFERWQDAERTRYRRQALAAAREMADRERRSGNLVGAARWLERALEISPLHESSARELVRLLDRAGDRSGAVRAYDRFTDRLRTKYGIDPSPETEEVMAGIRARQTPHQGARETGPPADRRRRAGRTVRSAGRAPADGSAG